MNETDERRIMKALERAVKMANTGTHPNEAIAKVASEERFTQPIVQRMVEAFNISKTLAFMKVASGAKRAESFPLADAAGILGRMYTTPEPAVQSKLASFVPDTYGRSETTNFNKPNALTIPIPASLKTEKVAAYPADPNVAAGKEISQRRAFEKKAHDTKSEYQSRVLDLMGAAQSIGYEFRKVGHVPFAEIERHIWAEHGQVGKSAMDLIYGTGNLREKRAEAPPDHQVLFDSRCEPYKSIEALIKLAFDIQDLASQALEAEEAVASFKSGAQVAAGERQGEAAKTEKLAGTLGTMGLLGMVGLSAPDPESTRRKAMQEVIDPIHESRLAAAKTKAMLNDLASNDPILSGYEPHALATAYNQIAEFAPSVAQQPAVMRGMLRRMMQQEGVLEPHEAEQLGSIEKNLRGQGQYEPTFGKPAIS
jgi:hypothetical protein